MVDVLPLAANVPTDPWTKKTGEARRCVRQDGFAVVKPVFSPHDLLEVELLLDSVLDRIESLIANRARGERRFARDMGATAANSAGPIDQPEILYPASMEPRLVRTRLFAICLAFARAIAGGPMARCFDHVIVKRPWNKSVTPWHQDAALARFRGLPLSRATDRLHFWIPLQDVTVENGCMEFISGSHLVPLLAHKRFKRGNGDIGHRASPDDAHLRTLCPVAAGGFTVHTPRTLHHSGRNATALNRKAWIIHFSRFGGWEIGLKRAVGRVPAPLSKI